jgi:uncharacterized membrane protein YgdD (TMEM256/DUF423 family)
MLWKVLIVLGAVNAALAVGIGAFGAHGLESRLSNRMIETYNTGAQYHMYHSLGLIAIGAVAAYTGGGSALLGWSGWLLFAGIILFSGSLYVLSLSGISWLGAVTPLGGVAFIAGWICLIIYVLKA